MEENKSKYLESNRKTRKILIIVGSILLGLGVILTIVGIFLFSSALSSFEAVFVPIIPLTIGIAFDFAGGVLLMLGLIGPTARYLASQAAPVQKDTINYMLDGTRDETVKTVEAVSQGLKQGLSPQGNQKCPHCGFIETADATFCSKCGRPLGRVCPECGKKNESDAAFCSQCGHHFEK